MANAGITCFLVASMNSLIIAVLSAILLLNFNLIAVSSKIARNTMISDAIHANVATT